MRRPMRLTPRTATVAACAVALSAAFAYRRDIAVTGIRFYQKHLQPESGCMYDPYCSDYGIAAIRKQGVRAGIIALADRIERCTRERREEFHASHSCGGCDRRSYDPCR
jgi:putative component of membrane protein insertase Oxa1/YidC/SpoIIIJ protein YidD